MSLIEETTGHVLPELEKMADDLADRFLAGFDIDALSDETDTKVKELLRKGARFKIKAMQADTQELAREYAEAVETTIRRVKTFMLAERIVAEQSVANAIAEGFNVALDALATVAKGVLSTVVSGIVSGAISSFGGEGGDESLDPSGIFPFLK